MNLLKKYWWAIMLIIILPSIVNLIMIQPKLFKTTGNASSWLSFWGSYIGAILSSSIAIFILYKQQEQNHKENYANRKLQLSAIKYNQEIEKLRDLRSVLIEFQVSFDFIEINKVAEKFIKGQYDNNEYNRLKYLIRDIDEKSFKVTSVLTLFESSDYINKFNLYYNKIYNSYGMLIEELCSFFDLMSNLPVDRNARREYVIQELNYWKQVDEQYKESITHIQGFRPCKSIHDIIVSLGKYENIEENAPVIIRKRLLLSFDDSKIKEVLKDIIEKILNDEQRRIDNILNV